VFSSRVFFLFGVKSSPKMKNDDVIFLFFKEGNNDEKKPKGLDNKNYDQPERPDKGTISFRSGFAHVDVRPLFERLTSTLKLLLMATRNPIPNHRLDGALKPFRKECDKSTNFPQLVSFRRISGCHPTVAWFRSVSMFLFSGI